MHDKQAVRWILLREDIQKRTNVIARMILRDKDLSRLHINNNLLSEGMVDVEKFLDWWTYHIPTDLQPKEPVTTPRSTARKVQYTLDHIRSLCKSRTGGAYTMFKEMDQDSDGILR